jgi:hypothetical protein
MTDVSLLGPLHCLRSPTLAPVDGVIVVANVSHDDGNGITSGGGSSPSIPIYIAINIAVCSCNWALSVLSTTTSNKIPPQYDDPEPSHEVRIGRTAYCDNRMAQNQVD